MKKQHLNRKNFFMLSAVFLLSFFVISTPVLAHTVKVDGTIQALLHIDPGDDPITNSPSRINLEITDINHKFSISQCNCSVSILHQNQELVTKTIGDTGVDHTDSEIAFTYVFPTADIYQIRVTGVPLSSTTPFQTFTMTYDIRVEKNASSSSVSTLLVHHAFHLILIGIAIIVGIIFTILDYLTVKKKS